MSVLVFKLSKHMPDVSQSARSSSRSCQNAASVGDLPPALREVNVAQPRHRPECEGQGCALPGGCSERRSRCDLFGGCLVHLVIGGKLGRQSHPFGVLLVQHGLEIEVPADLRSGSPVMVCLAFARRCSASARSASNSAMAISIRRMIASPLRRSLSNIRVKRSHARGPHRAALHTTRQAVLRGRQQLGLHPGFGADREPGKLRHVPITPLVADLAGVAIELRVVDEAPSPRFMPSAYRMQRASPDAAADGEEGDNPHWLPDGGYPPRLAGIPAECGCAGRHRHAQAAAWISCQDPDKRAQMERMTSDFRLLQQPCLQAGGCRNQGERPQLDRQKPAANVHQADWPSRRLEVVQQGRQRSGLQGLFDEVWKAAGVILMPARAAHTPPPRC